MLKCVKITSFFFVLLFELLPDTTSTVSGDCDFLRSCVNYKYIEKKKKYPTMMKLGTVIPYLKKIKNIYMSHMVHPLSSADISIFSPEISKF